MINLGEDELICDLAETYNLYFDSFIVNPGEWPDTNEPIPLKDIFGREFKPLMVATLSCGLSETSRIKMKVTNRKASLDQILLAASVDRLSVLIWQKTKDGQKNRNHPKSIVETLLGDKKKDELEVFEDEAAFEEWYRKTRT